jgi:hypothetical protein
MGIEGPSPPARCRHTLCKRQERRVLGFAETRRFTLAAVVCDGSYSIAGNSRRQNGSRLSSFAPGGGLLMGAPPLSSRLGAHRRWPAQRRRARNLTVRAIAESRTRARSWLDAACAPQEHPSPARYAGSGCLCCRPSRYPIQTSKPMTLVGWAATWDLTVRAPKRVSVSLRGMAAMPVSMVLRWA